MLEGNVNIESIAETLSPASRKVYNFIVDFLLEHTYPPVIRDICEGTGLKSTSSVFNHIETLEEKGLIKIERRGKHSSRATRSIRVVGYRVVKI